MHPTRDADLATELPAWRIVDPRPAAELRRYYREAERRFGVDWEYLAAINLVETGFGRIDGTSVAGARGPMQFIPTTWDIYGAGGDIEDPHDAILAAGRLLRANGFARDRAGALLRYNNSSAYVRGVTLYAEVMQRRPRDLPRLPPVADLLPDARRQRLAARGLLRAAAGPGEAVAGPRGPLSHPRPAESPVMQAESPLVQVEWCLMRVESCLVPHETRPGGQSVPWRRTNSTIVSASSGRQTMRSGSEVSSSL